MRKNYISFFLACGVLAAPLASQAGLFDAVTNTASTATGGGASSGGSDAGPSQDALVQGYVQANKSILIAQSKMASALGAKDAAAKAKAEADALNSGATVDNLNKADSVQSDVSKAISDRQADKSYKMDAASKKEFSAGMATLGKGLLQYALLAPKIQSFTAGLKSASPLAMAKLSSGIYIAKSLPSNASNLKTTLSSSIDYAKSNDIPVPADATKAL